MANIAYTPAWKRYEADLHSPDTKKQVAATEKFDLERQNELKKDPKARRWEASRKNEWAKAKPEWVKRRIRGEEEKKAKPLADLKKAGSFYGNVSPLPGYLIVKIVEEIPESPTGIVLSTDNPVPNLGLVLAAGGPIPCEHYFYHPAKQPDVVPCEKGDRIIFKKGAGLEIVINNSVCHLMAFSDVLCRLEDDA